MPSRTMRRLIPLLLGLAACAGTVHAQGTIVPEQEYEKKIKATERVDALTSSLFGDSVSLYNGAVEFTQVDIDLPGNNGLPVRLARRLKIETRAPQETIGGFADWEIEVPYIHAVVDKSVGWTVQGANPNARCSAGLPPRISTPYFRLDEVWHGTYMHIPGEGGRELYKNDQAKIPAVSDGQQYPWITRDYYRIRCAATTVNGYPGESFIAVSPNGLKYFFNHGSHVLSSTLGKGTEYPAERVERYRVYLRATRIEDRFGNFVNLNYAGNALTSIVASDGRAITFVYSGGKISQATANGRTWTYSYRPQTANTSEILQTVGLPDGSSWQLNWPGMPQPAYDSYPVFEEERPDCPETYSSGGSSVLTMRHPSGAQGEFTYAELRHRRDGVPGICIVRGPGYQAWTLQHYFDSYALTAKRITGNSVTPMQWSYDYETGSQHISQVMGDCIGCNTTKDVIVTNPDGTKEHHRFGVTFGVNEGRLLRRETRDASGVVRRVVTNAYVAESAIPSMPFSDRYGHSYLMSDPLSTAIRPVATTNIEQEGVVYSSSVTAFDVFARPATTVKSNTLGYSRTDGVEYEDNLSLWVIGQAKRNTTNGVETSRVTYATTTALPIAGYSFNRLVQTATYNADGTVATVADGRGNVTALSDWKRGIPRLVTHPDTTTESATVDDNGWITSITNEAGFTTGYGYDSLGRLASIVHPANDGGIHYHNTLRNFRALTSADWKPPGVMDGQWRLYEETGARVKLTYMDAMWRPVLVHEYDAQNVGPSLRASRTTYDINGRVSFQSYPASDLIPGASGTRTFYDLFDRVTTVEQDSELGVLTTTTAYQSGLKTLVTNPRGFQTTNSFMAWDYPIYDFMIRSDQPEGKVIEIARHPHLGWPLELKQRNSANTLSVSRGYVYDAHGQLCKTIEPETGVTVMDYDPAGNLSWQASGLNVLTFGASTDCQRAAALGSGRAASRAYDTRNRLTQLNFPNGRGNQIWTYTPDGLPASITAYNGLAGSEPVTTAYTYNKRRLLTGESITQFNGASPWYTWTIGYAYDPYGHLAAQTYPTGLVVDYAPNPLGQATKAGAYASGAQYYPNGALKQFTYGNGIVHTMQQNARQLPSRVTSSGGVNDFTYNYDANGNVTNIWDLVRGDNFSRWLSYDNLDRLTAAGSASFGGDHWHRFTYDALDNLESWKLAGVKDYADYVYDQQNRLLSIRNTAGATVVGLDYDPQGNLQNKNGQGYEFDYGNRLRSVAGKEHYRYDGLGRRVQTISTNGTTTLWQYSQSGQMLFWSDWEGPNYLNQKTYENVYLAGSLIATIDHAWLSNAVLATKYQHTDALGSPVAVTNALGQVIERLDYEPWGAIIGNPTRSGMGYTGHVMDGATGLTYMQQRYYDQSVGRFLSVDPVIANGNTGVNFNRYRYSLNNPYKYTDPDGRCESIATCQMMRDDLDLINGRMSRQEYDSRTKARAGGVLFGLAIVATRGRALSWINAGRTVQARLNQVEVGGIKVGETPSAARTDLEKAGFPGQAISNAAGTETGTLHNIPGLKMDVRVMNGGPHHGPRIVTTRQGSSQPVNPSNGRNFGNISKDQQRAQSHIKLKPDK